MRFLSWLVCLLALGLAPLAQAARCGSDVNGRGKVVPCGCGDVLVSSHTLSAADPITQHRCPDTGLTIQIPLTTADATLALGGQVLAGMMQGIGLHIVSGGAGGLTVAGPGAIGGFDTGVAARRGSLLKITDVLASGNAADGFALNGDGFTLRTSEGSHNGRDGIVVRGSGFRLTGTRADQNGRYGYLISGRSAAIGDTLDNQAMGNGRDGFVIRGRDLAISQPVATANGRRGLRTHITRGTVRAAQATANAGVGAGGNQGDRLPRCSHKGSCR